MYAICSVVSWKIIANFGTFCRVTLVVIFVGQESLCFLVDKLVEEDCDDCASKRNRRIEVDSLESGESIVEKGGHADTKGGSGVHNCAINLCCCLRLSVENGASSNIWGGKDEAVDSLLIGEKKLFVSVSHEEKYVDEGAEEFLAESSEEEASLKIKLL